MKIVANTVVRYYRFRKQRGKKQSDKESIYIRAYCNGELVELGTTGIKIDTKTEWNYQKNCIENIDNNPDLRAYSEKLEAIKIMLNEIVEYHNKEGIYLDGRTLKYAYDRALRNGVNFTNKYNCSIIRLYSEFIEEEALKPEKDKSRLAYNTLRDYKYKLLRLQRYVEETKVPVTINHIDRAWIKQYKNWLMKLPDSSVSSVNKHIMRLKVVLRKAVEDGEIIESPIENIRTPKYYEFDLTHLTMDQVKHIYRFEYSSLSFRKVIDMYAFSCATGISYTDILNLRDSSIDYDARCIKGVRQKTKTKFTAPLTDIAAEIIVKYGGSIENIPRVSNQKCNKYLKGALLEAGIPEPKRYTFHSGRKTFVTYCLNRPKNPVPPHDLIKMVGHSKIDELRQYGTIEESLAIQRFFA
ncbi:tyrosine-type recombinase/integrase [Flectobacillus rivi]|uniref:Phage integrase SAM-like domain-containing protein n=1 Tax=Flectobacillus rivi TaxID=2984209 RepID=A0ABT6Z0C2_9BACT|nr:phage integrase SAM-like domain-containing protein [Flectobacillus rivi]MDI9874499.1 phage integrase SAM-like domain-containing protein [Flectobacillus rivi]